MFYLEENMKSIVLTNDISKATLVTHKGNFHADEVMATVILYEAYEKLGKEAILCRVDEMPTIRRKGIIVYDIGGGWYDHHQIGGNGERKNGVPYSSCGLIWKKFGNVLVSESSNPTKLWHMIDCMIVQGIDAIDNGTYPEVNYPAHIMGISSIISSFNPNWESEETSDEAFVRAFDYAKVIFDNVIKNCNAKVNSEKIVEEEIRKCEGKVLVLDKYIPWQDTIIYSINPKAKDLLFIVFPSNRGGYNWQSIPKKNGSFEVRKTAPNEWWGRTKKELREITGIETVKFCHNCGFIGGCETLEDTIKMVNLAVDY